MTARWVGLPARDARLFLCSTTSVGILSYEHHTRPSRSSACGTTPARSVNRPEGTHP